LARVRLSRRARCLGIDLPMLALLVLLAVAGLLQAEVGAPFLPRKVTLAAPRTAGARLAAAAPRSVDLAEPRCAVVSWNLLSSTFSKSRAVPSWPARREQILQELASVDADVVCLQEMDRAAWPDFRDRAAALGYEGHLQDVKGEHPIANALLVRSGLVTVERTESRSRVLIAVLRTQGQKGGAPLYLANCHLEAGVGAGGIRFAQLRSLARRLQLQMEADGIGPAKAPVLLAGDFNFNRTDELHAQLSRGFPSPKSAPAPARPCSGRPRREAKKRTARGLRRGGPAPLPPLRDAYIESPPRWAAPRATQRSGSVLDYVWASDGVRVLRTLPQPRNAPRALTAWPSAAWPSDHLPVGAVVSWEGGPWPEDTAEGAIRPPWQQLYVEDVTQQT